MPLSPGTRIGPYEVIDRIGAGGMGEVYRVTDTRLGREAAMKVLLEQLAREPTAIDRFMREARAASSLNHPNIVTIHEIGQAEQGLYIVMELVRGGPLRRPAGEMMASRALLLLGRQLAEALAVAHAAGIVHRDIKPENILVREDGYAKILDFGIARLLSPRVIDGKEQTLTAETGAGVLLGSMRYMSPEQARGERVAPATDVFSLGIVIYELATGVHPFEADSPLSVLTAILTRTVIPPSRLNPEIPAALDSLLQRMLDKDDRLRPGAAACAATFDELAGAHVPARAGAMSVRPARQSVGRAKERAALEAAFDDVSVGSGLLVTIAGEPGIGKTTLVEDFLSQLSASERRCRIARGRCSDRLAGSGAYLPLLEALDALLHGPDGDTAAASMKLLAPTWYVQLARLPADDASAVRLREDVSTGSQERLKRELGVFLREMSRSALVVLAIEDIHWADLSTIDLLTYLSGMLDSLRLLVVATYRPSDLLLAKHPFAAIKSELQARGVCREIQLGFLSAHDVDVYLAMEFPEHRFPRELGALIHEKTEGSPLFMTELTRYLRDRQVVAQEDRTWVLARPIPDFADALPESIRGMIQRKIDTLTEIDRRLLLAGSVQGYEFDSAVVAKAVALDPVIVEERLDDLERVLAFVHCVGERELPDRTPNLRYRFVHILYQQALYTSVRAARRANLSAAVAQPLETFYRSRPQEVASELALLFEAARDSSKAVGYFLMAARQAARVFASAEAIGLARHGLRLLEDMPAGPERDLRELEMLVVLTRPLINTQGYSSSEVEQLCERALQLCERLGETPLLIPVLMSIWQVQISRGALPQARETAERTVAAANRSQEPLAVHNAAAIMGITFVCSGELSRGHDTLQRAIQLLPADFPKSRSLDYGQDPMSAGQLWLALALTFLGRYREASDAERAAMTRAADVNHPFSLAYALQLVARRRQLLRDIAGTREFAQATMNLSQHRGFSQMLVVGAIYDAWGRAHEEVRDEHVAALRENLAIYRNGGSGLQVPHYLGMLAECCALNKDVDRALELVDEGLQLVAHDEAYLYEADLLRIRGELLSGMSAAAAETAYREAIDAARRSGARLIEARSAAALSRLLVMQNRGDEADDLTPLVAALPGDDIRLVR